MRITHDGWLWLVGLLITTVRSGLMEAQAFAAALHFDTWTSACKKKQTTKSPEQKCQSQRQTSNMIYHLTRKNHVAGSIFLKIVKDVRILTGNVKTLWFDTSRCMF